MANAASADNWFIAIKNGYKVRESNSFITDSGTTYKADYGHWLATSIRIGYEWDICFKTYLECSSGYSHDSQLLSGKPFNDDYEYTKSELFFEIKVKL